MCYAYTEKTWEIMRPSSDCRATKAQIRDFFISTVPVILFLEFGHLSSRDSVIQNHELTLGKISRISCFSSMSRDFQALSENVYKLQELVYIFAFKRFRRT